MYNQELNSDCLRCKTLEEAVDFVNNLHGITEREAETLVCYWLKSNNFVEVSIHQRPVKGFTMYELTF